MSKKDEFTPENRAEFKRALRDKGITLIKKIADMYREIDVLQDIVKAGVKSKEITLFQEFTLREKITKLLLDSNKYFSEITEVKPPTLKANLHHVEAKTVDMIKMLETTPASPKILQRMGKDERRKIIKVDDKGTKLEEDYDFTTENTDTK